MLKTEISSKKHIDIKKFLNLTALLKNKSKGYKPKKSRVLNKEDTVRFLQTAGNEKYLSMKGMIFGLAGGCRREELTFLRTNMVIDEGSCFKGNIGSIKLVETVFS